MAIEGEAQQKLVIPGWRTQRVQIETPPGGDPRVEVFRGSYEKDSQTGEISNYKPFETPPVVRSLSAVVNDTVVLQGVTVSAPLVAAAISAFADKWHEEDIAAAAAQAAALAAQQQQESEDDDES